MMGLFRNLPRKPQPPTLRNDVVAADKAVLLAFQNIRHAYEMRQRLQTSGEWGPPLRRVTPCVAATFERQAWHRLIRYLTQLPPPAE
jgi:hypothetical protein